MILVSVPYLFLCFGSSFLALRDAQVDPSAHMRELHSLVGVLQENLAAHLVVKAFGLRGFALRRFQDDLDRYRRSSVRFGFLFRESSLVGTVEYITY